MLRYLAPILMFLLIPLCAWADVLPFPELKQLRWGMTQDELRTALPRPADITNQRPNPKNTYVLYRLRNYTILDGVFDICFWIDPRDGRFRRFHIATENEKNPPRDSAIALSTQVVRVLGFPGKTVSDTKDRYEVHWTPPDGSSRIALLWTYFDSVKAASLTVTFEDPNWSEPPRTY